MVNFMFTNCPTTCPPLSQALLKLQEKIASLDANRDYFLELKSITGPEESVENVTIFHKGYDPVKNSETPSLSPTPPSSMVSPVLESADLRLQNAIQEFIEEVREWEEADPIEDEDVDSGTRKLIEIVAKADGLQCTGDTLGSAHHFSNVLFNVMRGGIFEAGYALPVGDFASFVRAFRRETHERHLEFFAGLGDEVDRSELLEKISSLGDPDLRRLALEYLPLSFSRRHGDPSRPWNRFSIRVKAPDGSKLLSFSRAAAG